jgi:translation initiation factor 3 subunit D
MYSDRKGASKYAGGYGAGGQAYAYIHDQHEETSFQIVDTVKSQKTRVFTKSKYLHKRGRSRQDGARKGLQVPQQKHKERRSKQARYQKSRYFQYNQVQAKTRENSVTIKNSWKVVEGGEMDFTQLSKLNFPLEKKPETLCTLGNLGLYQKQYDRLSVRMPQPLCQVNRRHYRVSTTDDPVIKKLAKQHPECNVFATDAILTTLMTCARSVYSWDIIVQRIGDRHIFFDMREESKLDLPSVSETAAPPPQDERGINTYNSLMAEATYINRNFSQQVLRPGRPETIKLDGPNPFDEDEQSNTELASVAYRYRKWDLGNDIQVVSRCELDAYMQTTAGEAVVNIKALNEWDPKVQGANIPEWREKLDKQRGAVLATEIRNNSFKMAKWTMGAILGGADFIKFGYVSRVNPKDSTQHTILGVQQFQPQELAKQMTLNVNNAWGVLRVIIERCLKMPPGKYLIMKDANRGVLRIYSLPAGAFEDDEDDEEEEESEEGSEEEEDSEEEGEKEN